MYILICINMCFTTCVCCHFSVSRRDHTCTVEKVMNTDGPNPSQFTSADRLQRELLHTTASYHVPSSAVSSKGALYEQRLRNLECVLGTEGKYILHTVPYCVWRVGG